MFYYKNPEAAKTKRSACSTSTTAKTGSPGDGSSSANPSPTFPTEGWTYCPSSFPKVTFTTIIHHMAQSGKRVKRDSDGDTLFLSMRVMDRAKEFYFGGYVQDVSVCNEKSSSFIYVRGKCWASQKKTTPSTSKWCSLFVLVATRMWRLI